MYYYEILKTVPATVFSPATPPGMYAEACAPVDLPFIAGHAERIWRDDGGGKKVVYWKQRNTDSMPVDMKEFSWIKLTARKLP